MKVTIEIKVTPKGADAMAQEIHSLLPDLDHLHVSVGATKGLVSPAKYRLIDNQTQSSYITFEN